MELDAIADDTAGPGEGEQDQRVGDRAAAYDVARGESLRALVKSANVV